jgi:hypothetical protein
MPITLVLGLVDVTGDGIKDVVAAAPRMPGGSAIFLWAGVPTLSGTIAPTATLVSSNRSSDGALGDSNLRLGVQFADLDLDGITDVIASAPYANIGPVIDAGAVFFFAGGALAGTVTETARFRRTSPKNGDHLSFASGGLQIADVTEDGNPDVVEGSPDTAIPSDFDAGAIHVWAGRPGLAGDVFPSASLQAAGSSRLTLTNEDFEEYGIGMVLADVTGDGVLDVIAASGLADLPGLPSSHDEGAIYVWAGGAGLASGGVVAPTATLLEPDAGSAHYLGLRFGDFGAAVRTVDLNGDGIRDVIACESLGYGYYGYFPSEKVLIWFGGAALAGTPPPDASAETGDTGDQFTDGGRALDFADVTGDGYLDLVGSAPSASNASGTSNGVIFVFAGGPGAKRSLPIHQRLEDTTGSASRLTMESNDGSFADVDADGYLDVLVADPYATITQSAQGAVFWFRGPILTNRRIEPKILSTTRFGPFA